MSTRVYTHLHFYQCSWCKTTATSPVYDAAHPPKCGACLRYMARKYAEPIETEAQQALVDRGMVFNPYRVVGPLKRTCDTCKAVYLASDGIDLDHGGRYCSAACADIGTEKHRAALERSQVKLEQLYQEQPWLRPTPSTQR